MLLRLAKAALALCGVLMVSACPERRPAESVASVEKAAATEKTTEKKSDSVVPPAVPKPSPLRAERECAAAIDPGPTSAIQIGVRNATLSGAHLTFSESDADGALTLGLLGPVNEDSGENLLALKRYLKFFEKEQVDAVLLTGDVGDTSAGIARVVEEVAAFKVPVLVLAGNQECRAEFTDGVAEAQKRFTNVVNLNAVRVVEFPELALFSLPGYHDKEYLKCPTGCLYFPSTLEEIAREAATIDKPKALVSHGPPRGNGHLAHDYAGAAGNVGDEAIPKLMSDAKVSFGFASNIKEAGGRATSDAQGTVLVKENTPSQTLFINPGPADTFGWEMNDGTKSVGMAAVFRLKGGQATWKSFRMKPLTSAEKAEAKKLAAQRETKPAPQ
jgi:Icc-related predicted phosphoesterase